MYRAFASAGRRAGVLCAALLALSACGSAPEKPAPEKIALEKSALEKTERSVEAPAPAVAVNGSKASAAVLPPASSLQPPALPDAPIPPEAQMQFDNALATLNSGNLGSAEQAFRSLSASYPTYAGPLLNLAILQMKAGRLADAEKTLNEAIARNGSNAAAFNQLGIVYRRLGRFKEADAAYQSALRVDPNYALAYLNLGVLSDLYLQQPQRALEAYERYLELAATPDAKVSGWVTELKTRLGNQARSAKVEQ